MRVRDFIGFRRGINFGLWLSQFEKLDAAHFSAYNVERDFEFVARLGFDHVRLPIDYELFGHGVNGFEYIDNAIAWCKKFKLNLILDLHRAEGFSFDTLNTNTFFTSAELQEKFFVVWELIAARYKNEKLNICYELLNEITDNHNKWNDVVAACVGRIRKLDKIHTIIVGSNHYNEARHLRDLKIVRDPNVVYTFHCYSPHVFTHQRAPWSDWKDLKADVLYPSGEFGKRELEAVVKLAADFALKNDVRVYCGEFGVCKFAPDDSARRWFGDLVGIFNKYNIGHAVWNYKEQMFRLQNAQTGAPNMELFELFGRG